MKLRLIRQPCGNDSTYGVLFIDGYYFCFTLENTHKIIPAGTYELKLYDSPKNKCVVLQLQNVPNRSEIEIHVANWFYQLEGCIAVGNIINLSDIPNSRETFNNLMKKVVMPSTITIEDS